MRFDTEGMTVLNPAGQTVWAINEFPPQVVEFDFMNSVKARQFTLDTAVFQPPLNASNGLEGVTFLPQLAKRQTADNLFLLGHALTGDVYKFKIPSTLASAAQYIGKFSTWANHKMTDMDYHVATKTLYVMFGRDTPALLKAYSLNADYSVATEIGAWPLPGLNQVRCRARLCRVRLRV